MNGLFQKKSMLREVFWIYQVVLSYCKKRQKKSQPRTGLQNRERLKVLNDTKLILNDEGHNVLA